MLRFDLTKTCAADPTGTVPPPTIATTRFSSLDSAPLNRWRRNQMASAIQKTESASAVTQAESQPSDTAALLQMIDRAAKDPAYDIDKMERLVRMYNDMKSRACEQDFTVSMRTAQEDMLPVVKDANNPQTRSKYASYGALDKMVRPIYTKEGFVVSFDTGENPSAECVRVVAIVSHVGGFSRTYHVDMPADGKGAKGGDVMTKTHASGSAYSYGQRYLLKLIFNLATVDKADD